MVEVYSEKYNYLSTFVRQKIESFQEEGEKLGNGDRNEIKLFKCEDGLILNIKSFKVPNLINQVAYKHLRKSKARRSFEYAQKLQGLETGIARRPTSPATEEQKQKIKIALTNLNLI